MTIVWDEPKRLVNVARHEMDFSDLDEAFLRGPWSALQSQAA